MKVRVDDQTKERVLWALKIRGKATRQDLVTMLNMSDRKIRAAIEQLRRDGEPIGQAQDRGYTYGRSADVDRAIKDYYAKARTNWEIARALENRPHEGQQMMFI